MRTLALFARAATVLAVVAAGLVGAATPAAAATAPPWHFEAVTRRLTIAAGATDQIAVPCSGGYTPVSGGFTLPSREIWRSFEYPSDWTASYEFGFINGASVAHTIDVVAYCVLASDVGAISRDTVDFARSSSRADGTVTCPDGTRLLSGGADWSGGGDRRIDYSRPISLTTWAAGGYSTINGALLAIEVRCVDPKLLAAATFVAGQVNATYQGGDRSHSEYCPSRTRVLTGGAGGASATSGVDVELSKPIVTGWQATGYVPWPQALYVSMICVPVQAPVVTITSAPSGVTTSQQATLSFTASDSMGEPMRYGCNLDGDILTPCAPNTPVTVNGLGEGVHTFLVWADNTTFQRGSAIRQWEVDRTAPTIEGTPPTEALVADPVAVTLSEVAQGIDATSFTVAPTGGAPLAGTVTTSSAPGWDGVARTTATWQHSEPFVLGQWYTASLTSGVRDPAGNAMAPTSWQFRAIERVAPTVASRSSALGVTGPFTVTFSEPVTGVTTASLYAVADGATTPVAGKVTTALSGGRTVATWRPAGVLTPGRWYTVHATDAIEDQYGNALAPASWRVRAATLVQNGSPALTETWDPDRSSLASGGSTISSRTPGSAATLTVTTTAGQVVDLYGLRLPSGGYAEVTVDGVKSTVSSYAATPARARLYRSRALPAGQHTVRVRVLGTKPAASSGTWVNIDNVTAGAATYQETAFVQAFRRVAASGASGGSYDLVEHAKDASGRPAYTLRFWGNTIKLYATRSAASGQAEVYVDGALLKTVNLAAAATTYQSLVYAKSLGTAGAHHTIKIVPIGTTTGAKSAVGVDYLLVG